MAGDCVEAVPSPLPDTLRVVDCLRPHGGEVIERTTIPDGEDAGERCDAAFAAYTNGGFEGRLTLTSSVRTGTDGARRYLCVAGFEDRTGSIAA